MSCAEQKLSDVANYVGLSMSDAQRLAMLRHEVVRVVEHDGIPVQITLERNPRRVDVVTANDHIIQACHE